MSGKPTVTLFTKTPEEVTVGKIKFGKIDSAKALGVKFSRAAIGFEGMSDSAISCLPQGGSKYRDQNKCLHLVFHKMFSTGLSEQYRWVPKGKPPVERKPENVTGYTMMVPIVNRDTIDNPTDREKQLLAMFKAFHKAAQKFVLENKEKLPIAFKGMSDESLKKCVQPIETPAMTKADGTSYAPTLFCKVGYFPAKPAETVDGKLVKGRPEKFTTNFKGPKSEGPLNPKTLVKTPGNVSFVLRLNHLNFITGEDEDGSKIKFDTELTEVNFTKVVRVQANVLGDNDDEPQASSEAFSDIDPNKSYGDGAASSSYAAGGGEDESNSSEEPPKEVKKKKKVVEEQVEEVPPKDKKKKKQVVEED